MDNDYLHFARRALDDMSDLEKSRAMDNWDEIKTAFRVASLGTVSGAAEVLDVHHATVIRHIDSLEARLGVKLFQRHARGYTATEAGIDLLRVAQKTDDQFAQLMGRIKGRGTEVSGDLVVTSLASYVGRIAPLLTEFQTEYPDVLVRYLTGDRVFRLEYGEAHVAIRAGTKPEEPDNVVQPLLVLKMGAFASKSYVEANGMPGHLDDFKNHRFVGPDHKDSRAPYYQWLANNIPRENVTFRTSDSIATLTAVRSGAGIGFLPSYLGESTSELVTVEPPREEWSSPLWLVTHVDLHRTSKVQAFLRFIKAKAKAGIL